MLNFIHDGNTDAAASLIENFRPSMKIIKSIRVPVFEFNKIATSLDLEAISIIKIDVEGAELEVLRSLCDTITFHKPIILLEILPIYNATNTLRISRQEKTEELISDLNYSLFKIIKNNDDSYCGLEQIKAIGIHSDISKCDYVLMPNEMSY